jgi:hypothetical protein
VRECAEFGRLETYRREFESDLAGLISAHLK